MKRLLFMVLYILVHASSYCQVNDRPADEIQTMKLGFIAGYGGQNKPFVDVHYFHEVKFYQAQFFIPLNRGRKPGLDLVVQPQFNRTRYKFHNHLPVVDRGFEMGLNLGLAISVDLAGGRLRAYMMPSIGPHYVSGVPNRQSPGFIFSDNIFLGLMAKLGKGLWLDLRPGLRHISNAGLLERNGGVNNSVLSGGVLVGLK